MRDTATTPYVRHKPCEQIKENINEKILSFLLITGILLSSTITPIFADTPQTENSTPSLAETATTMEKVALDDTVTLPTHPETEIVTPVVPEIKDYVTLTTATELSRVEKQNGKFVYPLSLNSLESYDSVVVSYATTENLMLDSYHNETVLFNTNGATIPLSFHIEALQSGVLLDYKNTDFEKIVVNLDVYDNNEHVETKTMKLAVLSSEHGSFVSEYNIFAYDHYISYLRDNDLITAAEYKQAQRSMTELQPVNEASSATIAEPVTLRYFDVNADCVALSSQSQYNMYRADAITMSAQTETTSTSGTTGTIHPTGVTLSKTITALNSGAQLRVFGYVTWSDIAGNSFPARNIEIKIMDEDPFTDPVMTTTYTDLNGYYTATVNNENNIFERGSDIYVIATAKTTDFTVVSNDSASSFVNGYYFQSTVSDNVTQSVSQTTFTGSGEPVYNAVCIHQAMVVGYHYYKAMNGNNNVYTSTVYYPADRTSSSANASSNTINILLDDYCDWDCITHELGHLVAAWIGVDAIFDETYHMIKANLCCQYGKASGIAGAWNEGWASFFGTASQNYYNAVVANISGIINVADNATSNITWVDEENALTYNIISYNYSDQNEYGYGEGNEFAVTCVLLHLIDDLGLTHQALWNIVKSSACDSFSGFMKELYETIDESLYSQVGEILEKQNCADSPVICSVFSKNIPADFSWLKAHTTSYVTENNFPYSNSCKIVFWDKEYTKLFETTAISSDSASPSITPTATQWNTLVNAVGNDYFYWCLATTQGSAPTTGPYYSSFVKGFFAENMVTISNLNIAYNGSVQANEDVYFKVTVPSTGYYVLYSSGDLDLNATLYSTVDFTQSSYADDDSGDALNFMLRTRLIANKTYYVKVSGYLEEEGDFQVVVSYAPIISIETNVSGTVNGTAGNWYYFKAPQTGIYTFYSVGSTDTYAELCRQPYPDGTTGSRIAYSNNISQSNSNFMISYALDANEEIYLRVRGATSSVSGSYSVFIAPQLSLLDSAYATSLDYNRYTFNVFHFAAPISGDYTFYTTGTVDTYMEIFNVPIADRESTANRIAFDNDAGTSTNSAITLSLVAEESVFIRVRGNEGVTLGSYNIVAVKSEAVTTLDTTYNNTLPANGTVWYRFAASEAGTYSFYTTGELDTYGDLCSFFTPDKLTDTVLASNDDDEVADDPAVLRFRIDYTLTAGQIVYIRVRGYDEYDGGTFGFVVSKLL